MIDSEFERKGRGMSDELNQIIDLEYTWGDFPAVTAEQIYNRYDVARETAQLRAELQFQRQQVQDVAKVAEYYRELTQAARDERDAAIADAKKYSAAILNFVDVLGETVGAKTYYKKEFDTLRNSIKQDGAK